MCDVCYRSLALNRNHLTDLWLICQLNCMIMLLLLVLIFLSTNMVKGVAFAARSRLSPHRTLIRMPIKHASCLRASEDTCVVDQITSVAPRVVSANDFHPVGTTYCLCGNCKTAYLMDAAQLGGKGRRVVCNICSKDWFQTVDKLLVSGESFLLQPMDDAKIESVKKILDGNNTLRYPLVDKVGVFVGNLPYSFTEKELGDLLSEYGLLSIALVKNAEMQSKGFAFVEVGERLFLRGCT